MHQVWVSIVSISDTRNLLKQDHSIESRVCQTLTVELLSYIVLGLVLILIDVEFGKQ